MQRSAAEASHRARERDRCAAVERALSARRREPASLRIGDVARLVGTTPRTIRYYEEIGLLPEAPARPVRAATASTPRPRSSACAR